MTTAGIIRFFQDGGIFMFPIGAILIVGAAIVIERFIFLAKAKKSNRDAFDRILALLQKKDYQGALNIGKSSEAPVAKIISAGLQRMAQSSRREDIELAMEEGVMEAVPRLERRTGYLATLANVATLLGLLGTISGLSEAFGAVANADPSEKAALLSASIAVAMNATAFGLFTAIPLLLSHAMIQSRTLEIVDSLEMAGVKCMNILTHAQDLVAKQRSENNPAKQ
ncbi:MAG: MotA/TolQ/ExbB proton channel family protein [Gammaproteobacteria bacterium]|nr:MAG: MotA/TolQ/ExbB proton channel family protein [Gammaproteobacteria bacterium]